MSNELIIKIINILKENQINILMKFLEINVSNILKEDFHALLIDILNVVFDYVAFNDIYSSL
jgi:hypothetical protein